jgi:hypothetical protein
MTVSFLFGWQHILVGLLLLIAVAVVFVLVLAAGRGERSEWQAALTARSRRNGDTEQDIGQAAEQGIAEDADRDAASPHPVG